MATSKKYNEFASGTFDKDKITLQADAITGALEKINNIAISDLVVALNSFIVELNSFDYTINKASNILLNAQDIEFIHNLYIGTGSTSLNVIDVASDIIAFYNAQISGSSANIIIAAKSQVAGLGGQLTISTDGVEFSHVVPSTGESCQFAMSQKNISFKTDYIGVVSFLTLSGKQLNFSTTSGTLAEYANNAAALLDGLVVGDFYRTIDVVKIVH